MKSLKMLSLSALAALVMAGLAAGSASATFLEIKGVKQEGSIKITATLKTGTSTLVTDTFNGFANTCTGSDLAATITGFAILASGPVTAASFGPCAEDANEKVVVDETGSLSLQYLGTTTNGTARWTGARITTPSPFGKLTCATASEGTDIGTLTGVKEGNATLDFSAVLNCGLLTTKWTGTYIVTSPGNLGVTS